MYLRIDKTLKSMEESLTIINFVPLCCNMAKQIFSTDYTLYDNASTCVLDGLAALLKYAQSTCFLSIE